RWPAGPGAPTADQARARVPPLPRALQRHAVPFPPRSPVMPYSHIEKLIADHAIEFVDLRFADMRGVQHHVTYPVSIVEPALFEDGKMFDGSSIAGWKGINESDMVLLPD